MTAQNYWFKANKTGYGWHPRNFWGWLVLILYLGFLLFSFLQIQTESRTLGETFINFLPRFLLFTAILTVITYLKGESIQWGDRGKDQHKIP